VSDDGVSDFLVPPSRSEGEDLVWDVLDRLWYQLATPYDPDSRLWELTAGQRAVYALFWAYLEIGNGGLHQFFYNSTGYLLPEAVAGAELLGEVQLADALRAAAALIGDPYPRDRAARWQALEGLPGPDDPSWDRLDEVVYPILERLAERDLGRYVNDHPDDFFTRS
jgi:hypothetical protein